MTVVILKIILFSLLALSCQSDDNVPCQISDCGPHSCRTMQSGDLCYYIMYKASSFEDARGVCRDVGMTLASPINTSVPEDIIISLLSVHGAWLNAVAKPFQKWTFIGGKTTIMSGSGTDCGTMFSRYDWMGSQRVDYFFRARPCYEANKFICRKANCSPLTMDCIIHNPNTRLDWFKAREFCLQNNADLFYLNEDEKNDDMANAFAWSYHDVGNIFVGLRKRAWKFMVDSEEGEREVDMLKTNWKNGEPNRAYKNCVKLEYTGKWDDQECTKTGPFPLCTRDAVPLNEASTTDSFITPTTPFEETTTAMKLETTTKMESTTKPTTTPGETQKPVGVFTENEIMQTTSSGIVYKTPSVKDDYDRIMTTMLPEFEDETTNIPRSTAQQTTYASTLGIVYEEKSTILPKDKTLINTTPDLEELQTRKPEVKVVTIKQKPVHVITTRGLIPTTAPPSGKVDKHLPDDKKEDIDDKEALRTLTKLVLYKLMNNSAATNVPCIFYIITTLVILKDLFN